MTGRETCRRASSGAAMLSAEMEMRYAEDTGATEKVGCRAPVSSRHASLARRRIGAVGVEAEAVEQAPGANKLHFGARQRAAHRCLAPATLPGAAKQLSSAVLVILSHGAPWQTSILQGMQQTRALIYPRPASSSALPHSGFSRCYTCGRPLRT